MKFESLEKLLAYSIKILFCSTLVNFFSFIMTLQYSVIFKFFSLDLDSNKFISEGVNRKVIFSVLRFSILGRPPNFPHSLCLFFFFFFFYFFFKSCSKFFIRFTGFMLIYDLQKNTKLGEFSLFERSEKSKNGKKAEENLIFLLAFSTSCALS